MKIIKALKKIIMTILAVVFFGFAISMTILLLYYNEYGITEIDGKSLIIIKDSISSDKYKKGDVVVVESRRIDQIDKGDEIFAYRLLEDKSVEINIGIVEEVDEAHKNVMFENGNAYTMTFVAGEATKVYEKIGTYLAIVESTWGFLFIILVPGFLIFVYQVYALIVEIKYGQEE